MAQKVEQAKQDIENRVALMPGRRPGSLTETQLWNHFGETLCEELEVFFKDVLTPDPAAPEMPDEFKRWAEFDGPEVTKRQPLFMCGIARALGKAAGRKAGDVEGAPKELVLKDGRTLRLTNGKPWLDVLIPDFGLFAPGYGPSSATFSALLPIEMDKQSTGSEDKGISSSHNGKLLRYPAVLVSVSAFRELHKSRTFSVVTNGAYVRFASQQATDSGELKTRATHEQTMKVAWPWLWALLHAPLEALGWSVPTVLAEDGKEVPLKDCLGRGSFAAVYKAEEGSYVKVAIEAKAAAIENEVRVLRALHPETKVNASLTVRRKRGLETIPEHVAEMVEHEPAPAIVSEDDIDKELEAAIGKADKRSVSKIGCLPRYVAHGHGVLQARPVFQPVEGPSFGPLERSHIVDGLANLFRMHKRGVAHGEIAPRHCGIFNNRLGFYDFGCGNVGGRSSLEFSGGHWFASDRLLARRIKRAEAVVEHRDDVESFVKTVFMLLFPRKLQSLEKHAYAGAQEERGYNWQGILDFWTIMDDDPFWKGALQAARDLEWKWLFENLPGRGVPPERSPAPSSVPTVYRTKSGGKFHLARCRHLKGKHKDINQSMTWSEAKEQDLLCFYCTDGEHQDTLR